MELIAEITDEFFTGPTGIEVEYTTLVEQTAREIVADFGFGRRFDVLMIGPFDSPQFGVNGWLQDLTPFVADDVGYELAGFIPSVTAANSTDDGLFAVPFYAESSIIMYNQQIIDDVGIDFPENSTWQEVADIARQVDSDETSGICLRGLPGWGDFGASLTTVVNTFGGTWWEANEDGTPGEPQIDQPDSGFRAATEFYLDLAADAGPDNFTENSLPQCLELFQNGDAAIWYDSTRAAPLLEVADSPIAGNVGYARAPIVETDASGWLWTWGLTVPSNSPNPAAGWEFIRWATSPDTISAMAEHSPDGWNDPAVVGAATRASHFDIPELREATEPYGDIVFDELTAIDPNNPGTTPRPGLPGVQYVGIPEFQQVATDCTIELSAAFTGTITIDEALGSCQLGAFQALQDLPSPPGPSGVQSPSLVGMSLSEAQATLNEAGFPSTITFVYRSGDPVAGDDRTDSIVEGDITGLRVIDHDPPRDLFIPLDTEIDLKVSVGVVPTPELTQLTVDEARLRLGQAGIGIRLPNLRFVDPDGNPINLAGGNDVPEIRVQSTVISQEPAPGTLIADQAEVSLVAQLSVAQLAQLNGRE